MPPAATKAFVFVCGPDDFLVGRVGRERFDALVAEAQADDFSREIINGFAGNLEEVETAVNRFRDAVQTVPMFGGKRVVWLKDVSFLADNVTGRAEGTLKQVEALQEILAKVNPDEVSVVVTAAPVDRRRSFPKWCEANGDFTLAGGDGDNAVEALAGVALAEARAFGVTFGEGAVEVLLTKVGANTRLITEEVRKLATYVGQEGGVIEAAQVIELTPNMAEGDFFESAERFFAGDLHGTLRALTQHFFTGGDARPVLSSLQNRNRILIQARVLIDAGDLRAPGPYGFDKAAWARAQGAYAKHFGGDAEKSGYNLFTQNQWYVGKLVGTGRLPPLRRLIDNQQEFIAAFEEIIRRPNDQETVLREMAVRCLT
ncbi:DNA polymerase III subunit delta [Lacunisphaera limnophila]|uniref:DNA polymerase III subunit delta n=1 Tax=Lacunisphaera limnophila TaxID=1838286 RepID=A0A1D8ATE5_9BACT|nr:DNA polymerase III subunit delta [Lacunisphaera limnophila]AOS44174.1 DNA polymerase III subunit delta [Lacunisphaera limnophila]